MPTVVFHRGRCVRTPVIEGTLPSLSAPPRPSAGGALFPLGLLSAGEGGEIMSIRTAPGSCDNGRTEQLGLRVGKTVEMLANGGGGPLLLKVDESRLAIDRRAAMKILVRRQR